ncbi:MAG: hypothetical protein GYB41_04385 [Oceanospirillales bacterium]|uniref:Tryptophan synthase subunit beta like protein n=1 Tax=Marinobacterium halophilum TaxID=267374 RepID=A0A2P8F3N0_9GAMM|nr:hypothetical protein [Marinobacterium halophilum]MBR9827870.1 hypothetical protein [Oceanospirillales bacterium]PSL16306.1 hypothetical protein CLV44_102231 [Marinobacterium halophilum]
MLYALRDDAGKITALTDRPLPDAQTVQASDPDVMAFLSLDGADFTASDFLDGSDLSTIRILEDLINTLIDRQIIRFTDLPVAAQHKLLSRKVARTLANPDTAESDSENVHQNSWFLREDDQLF